MNADKFLDMVPSLPVLFPDVKTRESTDDYGDETALAQSSMALEHSVLVGERGLTSSILFDETSV